MNHKYQDQYLLEKECLEAAYDSLVFNNEPDWYNEVTIESIIIAFDVIYSTCKNIRQRENGKYKEFNTDEARICASAVYTYINGLDIKQTEPLSLIGKYFVLYADAIKSIKEHGR